MALTLGTKSPLDFRVCCCDGSVLAHRNGRRSREEYEWAETVVLQNEKDGIGIQRRQMTASVLLLRH